MLVLCLPANGGTGFCCEAQWLVRLDSFCYKRQALSAIEAHGATDVPGL
jgi:hypothetical protein